MKSYRWRHKNPQLLYMSEGLKSLIYYDRGTKSQTCANNVFPYKTYTIFSILVIYWCYIKLNNLLLMFSDFNTTDIWIYFPSIKYSEAYDVKEITSLFVW